MATKSGVWPPSVAAYPLPLVRPSDSLSLGERAVPANESLLRPYFTALREQPDAGLALNVHLPFCPSRCLSCDRVAVVQHQPDEIDHYITNLDVELALVARQITAQEGAGRRLARVHLGGGSPNHLSELALATLFSHIATHFTIDSDTHVSMEVNPRRASRAQLNFLKGLGVEHIKLEVRDVDANVQREIGRIQSLELLEDVISIAHGVKFKSIGMDYLVGLPGQTPDSCEQSVEAIVSLSPDWLVCLPFHRREHAFPHQIAVEPQHLPSLADRLVMFNQVQQGFAEAGYEWVGLNVFAKPDSELANAQRERTLSLNVLGYAAQRDLSVIGVGLGALGELPGVVVQNVTRLAPWHALLESGMLPAAAAVVADSDETIRRKVMRALVCGQTVPTDDLGAEQHKAWLKPLLAEGYANEVEGHVLLTDLGRSLLPHVWTDSSPAFRAV